jgi:CheY-like chemotaxis protein
MDESGKQESTKKEQGSSRAHLLTGGCEGFYLAEQLLYGPRHGWHHDCSSELRIAMNSEPEPEPEGKTFELKAILVVDDDQQLASALQWILADANFLVDVAFNGEEAILKVTAHEYDAIICDLKMPKLRGDQFYLKAREIRPALTDRFIFITGYATDPILRSFLVENEVKFLVKPFPIKGLISCVQEMSR